jgi:hypothetical protein
VDRFEQRVHGRLMARIQHITSAFVGGELTPRLDGRIDVKKYAQGLRLCENFQVLPHGGARKRSGFSFVTAQKSATDDVIMVPFQYNVEQAYVLMFGPGYVWFFKDRGVITQSPVSVSAITQANPGAVTTSVAHGLTTGDRVVLLAVSGMSELNNRQFVVTVTGPTTFTLGVDTSGYDAYAAGGTVNAIVELATTYTAEDLPELAFAQTNDVLYIAHRAHPLRKISRLSHTSWTLSEPSITPGPFRSINADRDRSITCSNFSTSATAYNTYAVGTTFTMTSSTSIFDASHVGALFKLSEEGGATGIDSAPVGDSTKLAQVGMIYTSGGNVYGIAAVSDAQAYWGFFNRVPEHDSGTVRVRGWGMGGGSMIEKWFDSAYLHPTYCVVRVTGYISSTQVTAEIVRYHLPRSIVDNGTTYWHEGAWSAYRGYPRAIAFYEQRLFLAGSESDPTVLWGSRSGSYEDFEDGPDDDDAIVYRINAGSADVVRWLMSGRVLTAGTSMGEFAISASNQNEALTPKNFKAAPQTTYGTSKCPPVRFNQSVLYPQRAGSTENAALKVREFSYSFQADAFDSVDLTVFSEHITATGIDRMAFQTEPDSLIWARRLDGLAIACTYERAQEVVAWHRHSLGGTGSEFKTIAAIPGSSGDEVWASAKILLGAELDIDDETGESILDEAGDLLLDEATETARYVVVSNAPFRDDGDKVDAKLLDFMLTYQGDATTTISGLHHLRGLEVKVLNEGAVETHTVDDDGRVTLAVATTKAHVGLPYTAILETQDLEGGAQAGTAQSRVKRISQIYVRLLNSLGGSYGPDANTQQTIYYRTGADVHGSSVPLFSGLKELDFKAGFERFARVRIEHTDPLPFHVGGIVAELNTSG